MSRPPKSVLLCVGDIDMDIIVKVAQPPCRDQKVDGIRVAQTPGGMAANVAVAASRLGTPTKLIGAVGDDAMGREALAALELEGVDLTHVATCAGVATFFCIIMVDDQGEKALVKALSPAYLPLPDDITAMAFQDVAHMHMTFTRSELALKAIEMARRAGATISLDLEAADVPRDGGEVRQLIDKVDLLFISEQSRTHAESRIGPIIATDHRTVVMTRGAAGACVESGRSRLEVAGHTVELTDSSGAGDAFAGAFLHARLGGADDAVALRFANAAAALSTRAYGAQAGSATLVEVEHFLDQQAKEGSVA